MSTRLTAATLIVVTLILATLAASGPVQATRLGQGEPPPGATQPPGPLENGTPVPPAPPYTTEPSALETIDPHWRANVRANTDNTTYAQQEPSVAVNPLNPLNVVVAQKDERRAPQPNTATKEVWIDTSTDGGLTWPVQTHIPMPDLTLPQQSDPVVTFSDDNSVFVTIIGYNQSGGYPQSVLVARSTDGGLTWPAPAVNVDPGLGGSDKEWTTIDLNPASPYYRRLYVTWTNFSAGPQIIEKWSSDNGLTWNPPGAGYVQVSFGTYDTGQFSMPVTLPDGTVIVTWYNYGSVLVVARSTNGGQSFISPNTAAASVVGVNDVPGSNWRLNTIPSTAVNPATGTIVSVWPDGRHGRDDIYFTRSTNGGLAWSAPARVAHNPAGGSYQVEPWISAAPNGRFDVIWYDDRDFLPGAPNTFHIYATHSTDDGATWTGPDEQVTDAATDLNVGIPGGPGWNAAAGDYINVSSWNDGAYAVWTDTRSGVHEDIYTSRYSPVLGTPTPTPTGPTATPTDTPIPPSPTPTACGAPAQWSPGPNFPVDMIRAWGAWFPPNSRFYTLGGRTSDAAGSDIRTPYEYDPVANTWTQETATFPDGQVNNMVGGVLNGPSGWRIYVVGGSAAAATTATARVMVYDPVADTLAELTTDPWTGNAAGDTLPGGGAVYNNRLYVFGGFQINTGMVNTIYEFDPNGTAGSRWTLKTAMLPMALGYIPATTIGNYIYTAGGSEWDGTTITDSDFSYRYDPVADAVTTITSIPRLTAETRALTVNGTMWVLGGGRDAPNPSNEVNIFNPATNAWSTGPSFATARRNFPADIDPATGKIYIAGGYAPSSATNSMEIFTPAVLCATETPTAVPPTDTPTPLPPTATATPGSPQFRLYLPVALYNAGGARP